MFCLRPKMDGVEMRKVDEMHVESKRWMRRKIVTAITVDEKEGKAQVALRMIPAIGEAIRDGSLPQPPFKAFSPYEHAAVSVNL
jgi:hypothetical protein